MVEKRPILSPILSAVLELAKLVGIVLVIDSASKILSVSVVMIACFIGNYLALAGYRWLARRKQAKLEAQPDVDRDRRRRGI